MLDRAKHGEFMDSMGFTQFLQLPWLDQRISVSDVRELLWHYNDNHRKSIVRGVEIDLGKLALNEYFHLKGGVKKVELWALQAQKEWMFGAFFKDARLKNGYLINQCRNPRLEERVYFHSGFFHCRAEQAEVALIRII